jgi:hypothetical protein
MFIGPILILAMVGLILYASQAAPIVAHNLKQAEIEQAIPILQAIGGLIAAVECLTILVLLGNRKIFKVGEKKPVWERVR